MLLLLCAASCAFAGGPVLGGTSATIPHLAGPPNFEAFTSMNPGPAAEGMLRIDNFTQTDPQDGKPASQKTVAYLGYDSKNLYVIYLAYEHDPGRMRARMSRREQIDEDDQVGLVLDTFHDRRRGYAFFTNAKAIQQEAIWSEERGFDLAWDTVWTTRAAKNKEGWVAEFEIPFKSLRFSNDASQSWGIWLQRDTPRIGESDTWPLITHRIQGRLSQEGTLNGFENISPGRNMQFQPYGVFSSSRYVDQREASFPYYVSKPATFDAGLDAKMVLKDKLVFDFTVNPDFSQVESDEPANSANNRFEVFFPEKRPFFQENANFFQTPIDLYFTRRISNPTVGMRVTGKLGERTDIGFLIADDRSVGTSPPNSDPQFGKRAYFGIFRLNRQFGKENSVGMIFADREFTGGAAGCDFPSSNSCDTRYNRVGGIDFRYRIKNWIASGQALASSTWYQDFTHSRGGAYKLRVETNTRKYSFNSEYNDNAAGFVTRTGFFRRPDLRRVSTFVNYRFRREGKYVLWHGPHFFHNNSWAHDGTRLDDLYEVGYHLVFRRNSDLAFDYNIGNEKLRPTDYSTILRNADYHTHYLQLFGYNGTLPWVTINGELDLGREINFEPSSLLTPQAARVRTDNLALTFRPIEKLTIENKYVGTHLRDWNTNEHLFDDHVIRSKWNYQLNPKLSFRTIFQYEATLPNLALTDLENRKNFNTDFLVTYLIHPGTAVYVGYNHNLQNYDEDAIRNHTGLFRIANRYTNDNRQFFVKLSYLFRY